MFMKKTVFVTITVFILCSYLLGHVEGSKSSKKGLVIPSWPRVKCGDFDAFSTVSWWYNYHTYPDPGDIQPWWCTCQDGKPPQNRSLCQPSDPDVHFLPMVYGVPGLGHRPDDDEPPVDPEYNYLLGYNEPDRPDQSDIPPLEAAEAFAELSQTYPDKTLIGPAVAGPNTEWLDPFMEACQALGCRIDFIGLHTYNRNPNVVMRNINTIAERYGQKIFFTEFAVPNESDEAKIVQFVEELLPQLEQSENVFRYSWFITRYYPNFDNSSNFWLDPLNSLLEEEGPFLTPVGQAYDKPWHEL